MDIENLITEMLVVKAAHPSLTNDEIIGLFKISSIRDLTSQTRRLANK